MNFKEQKIKEFGDLFDNNFLQWDLTDKLGMKARAEAFLHKVLEEQEKELQAEFDNMIQKDFDAELEEYVAGKLKEQEKRLRLNRDQLRFIIQNGSYIKQDNSIDCEKAILDIHALQTNKTEGEGE